MDKGQVNLMMSILSRQTTMVRSLLDKGVDPNFHLPLNLTRDQLEKPLLQNCLRWLSPYDPDFGRRKNITKENYERKKIASLSGYTPLHLAVRFSIPDIVRVLLSKGANVNALNGDNETPLTINSFFFSGDEDYPTREEDIVKLLVNHGANINHIGGKLGVPICQIATMMDKEYLDFLLENGADPNVVATCVDEQSQTSLQAAVLENNFETVQKLLQNGAKILRDRNGQTPMHQVRSRPIVKLLLENGASINSRDNDGKSALDNCFDSPIRKISVLLQSGIDVNTKDNDGFTPLHFVCNHESHNYQTVDILKYGADVNATDKKGWTPYQYLFKKDKEGEFKYTNILEDELDDWKDYPEENMRLYLYKLDKAKMFVRHKPDVSMFDREWFDEYDKRCDQELQAMSEKRICDEFNADYCVSMLLKDNFTLPNDYIDQYEIIQKVVWGEKYYAKEFPLYSLIIRNQMHQCYIRMNRRCYRAVGQQCLQSFMPNIPSICLYGIVKYLTEEDIQQVHRAVFDSNIPCSNVKSDKLIPCLCHSPCFQNYGMYQNRYTYRYLD